MHKRGERDGKRTLVVLHPDIQARGNECACEVLGDPLALVDLYNRRKGLKHERERVLGRDGQEGSDVFRDPRCEGHGNRVVDVLAETARSRP